MKILFLLLTLFLVGCSSIEFRPPPPSLLENVNEPFLRPISLEKERHTAEELTVYILECRSSLRLANSHKQILREYYDIE